VFFFFFLRVKMIFFEDQFFKKTQKFVVIDQSIVSMDGIIETKSKANTLGCP